MYCIIKNKKNTDRNKSNIKKNILKFSLENFFNAKWNVNNIFIELIK